MTYSVSFTDATNPAKPALTVPDGALNQQTPLTFPGKNYSGYAPVIAGNFLHLLENFANTLPPSNPIQGQLWFDTANNNNTLKVYDGTNWNEAGNLKKTTFEKQPSIASSVAGDLWVDLTNSQLYLFSGTSWLLVGPQYSTGLATGPIVENITDSNNVKHPVISMFAASTTDNVSYRIAIISKDEFTPKASIDGFITIKEGINLYSNDRTGNTATLIGSAQTATSLTVNNKQISASNFLTTDGTTSTTNYPLGIQNAGGLSIGSDLSFNIYQGTNNYTFNAKNGGTNLDFNLNSNVLLHLDSTGKVGINTGTATPASTLGVGGVITSGVAGTAGGLVITDATSPQPVTVFSATSSGFTTSLDTTFSGKVFVTGFKGPNNSYTLGAINVGGDGNNVSILPSLGSSYDIGKDDQRFRNIYAESFVGSFTGSFVGSVTGNITGTADSLKNTTVFSVAGDIVSSDTGVPFNGITQNGTAVLNTVVSASIISTKPVATTSAATDKMLVYQSGVSGSKLVSMTKQTFLSGVATSPVGTILAFAGSANNLPAGYLLCDGSEVSTATYSQLFTLIGYTYGPANTLKGVNTFALPDLRGRFPLGADNMNNYGNVTGFVQAKDSRGTNVNTGGQIGAAGRVSVGSASITLGGGAGSQNVVLQSSNLPNHSHIVTDNGHTHNIDDVYAITADQAGPRNLDGSSGFPARDINGNPHTADAGEYAGGQNITVVNDNAGDGGQNDNGIWTIPNRTASNTTGVQVGLVNGPTGAAAQVMNPYLTINYIIFTGNI
jgi:microcystin-dependent protein